MKNNNLINSVSTNLIAILTFILGFFAFLGSIYIYLYPIDKPDIESRIFEASNNCLNIVNNFYDNQNKEILDYKNELSNNGYTEIAESINQFDVLTENKYVATLSNDSRRINIKKFNITNGKKELLEIENIIGSCKNMKLKNFCIGKKEEKEEFSNYGCSLNGLEVTLEYENQYDSISFF